MGAAVDAAHLLDLALEAGGELLGHVPLVLQGDDREAGAVGAAPVLGERVGGGHLVDVGEDVGPHLGAPVVVELIEGAVGLQQPAAEADDAVLAVAGAPVLVADVPGDERGGSW